MVKVMQTIAAKAAEQAVLNAQHVRRLRKELERGLMAAESQVGGTIGGAVSEGPVFAAPFEDVVIGGPCARVGVARKREDKVVVPEAREFGVALAAWAPPARCAVVLVAGAALDGIVRNT